MKRFFEKLAQVVNRIQVNQRKRGAETAKQPIRVNIAGEGEVPDVKINQNLKHILEPAWTSSRYGKRLTEIEAEGHQFVISDNLNLPFQSNVVDEVYVGSISLDSVTFLGPTPQTYEILRILKEGGLFVFNPLDPNVGRKVYQKVRGTLRRPE